MVLRNYKFIISAFIMSVLLNANIFSSMSSSRQSGNVTWKTVELRPDLNKDGKRDKLIVEYFEDDSKVYTKITPLVSGGQRGRTEEKVFEKATFQQEFNDFINKYVQNYYVNSAEKTTGASSVPKNIQDAQNKVITGEDLPKTESRSETEKTKTREGESTVEKIDEKPAETPLEKPVEVKDAKLIRGPYPYIAYYLKERPENLTFNYKYKKNSPMDMDEFIFIKTATNIRKEPNVNSAILKKANYSNKFKVIGKVKTNLSGGTAEWYEVYVDGKLGYVIASNAVKREFDWSDMVKRIDKANKFYKAAASSGKTIYVLDDYTPLGGGSGTVKDKFGNRENQSERGYLNSSLTGTFINIPDRSLMTILEETKSYIKVKIDSFNGDYYIKPSTKRLLKNSNINGEVTRFIYVDRSSQNEMIVEKNPDGSTWNVVTTSFVTTGKDSGSSYATPYGDFLIAYAKPVMQYTGSDNQTVVGDAYELPESFPVVTKEVVTTFHVLPSGFFSTRTFWRQLRI